MSERSGFENVIKWVIVGILAVLALKVVLSVLFVGLGFVFTVGGILWKLLPLLVLVWVGLKVWEWLRDRNGGSPASEPADL